MRLILRSLYNIPVIIQCYAADGIDADVCFTQNQEVSTNIVLKNSSICVDGAETLTTLMQPYLLSIPKSQSTLNAELIVDIVIRSLCEPCSSTTTFSDTLLARLILEGKIHQSHIEAAVKKLHSLSSYYGNAAYVLGLYYEGAFGHIRTPVIHFARQMYINAVKQGVNIASERIMQINAKYIHSFAAVSRKNSAWFESDVTLPFPVSLEECTAHEFIELLNTNNPNTTSAKNLKARADMGDELSKGFWIVYLAESVSQHDQEEIFTLLSDELVKSLTFMADTKKALASTSFILGRLQQKGLISSINNSIAEYLQTAVAHGFLPALPALAEHLQSTESGSIETQKKLLEEAVAKDYKPALYPLAQVYESEKKNSKGWKKARLLYIKAAKTKNKDALFKLAQLKTSSGKIPVSLYISAGRKGHVNAQYYLGVIYEYGVGVAPSLIKAKYWLNKAVQHKHIRAYHNLGEILYKEGKQYDLAADCFKKAIAHKVLPSMYRLAQMYLDGRGVPKDFEKATTLLTEAAQLGYLEAIYLLRKIDTAGVSKLGSLHSIDFLSELAKWGCPRAMYEMGWRFHRGRGCIKDLTNAMLSFHDAAERGHRGAMYELGWRYYRGIGVLKDDLLSSRWFRAAAELGHVKSMYEMGLRFHRGIGVKKNDAQSELWLREAAEKGHVKAKYELGCRYSTGLGVTKDTKLALKYLVESLKLGHRRSLYALWGLVLCEKNTVSRDLGFFDWLYKSASDGDPASQCFLGDMLLGEKNYEKARTWYERAAALQYNIAIARLGDLHYFGLGVAKNKEQARYWYEKSASKGSELAMMRLKESFGSSHPSFNRVIQYPGNISFGRNGVRYKLLQAIYTRIYL